MTVTMLFAIYSAPILEIKYVTTGDVKSEGESSDTLQKAQALLEEGRLDYCLSTLKQYWLTNPSDSAAILLFSRLMSQLDNAQLAESLSRLADLVKRQDWDDPMGELSGRQVFETAYQLIDLRLYDLAVMLMMRCLDEAPNDPTLNYELGFALMALGKYDEAINHFDTAARDNQDFDTVLNLAVCFSLTRQLRRTKSAIATLEKLAHSEEEKLELLHRKMVMQRLDQLRWKHELTARDWMYCLYGSILVDTDAAPGENTRAIRGVYVAREESYSSIARTLLIVKGVLEGLRLVPEAIEFYSPTSRPLAAILARLFDIPLDSYRGPDRPDRALLVMDWAPEIIGPHEVFSSNQENRTIFAYAMSSSQPLPLTPDMVAYLTDALVLPWKTHRKADGTRSQEELILTDDPDPDDSIPQILDRAWNMESEPTLMQMIGDTVSYFSDKRDYCIFGNPSRFSQRPEFSAEIPVVTT